MKIAITGNIFEGISSKLFDIYPTAEFYSRSSGYQLVDDKIDIERFCKKVSKYDVIILSSALHKFGSILLLEKLYEQCQQNNNSPYIICLGSTIDRYKNGNKSIYGLQKKALREYCNTLSIRGVHDENMPKVTYISFSTLSDKQEKHPDRECIDINLAAEYIKWLIEQPKNICINEISIDAMQKDPWKID